MLEPFPGQAVLPFMPEPITPPPAEQPDPMWVTATVVCRFKVKIDVAGLIHYNRLNAENHVTAYDSPLNYDAITDEYLSEHAYGADERGAVFIHNNIYDLLELELFHGGTSKNSEARLVDGDGEVDDIRFTWNERLQAELDARLPTSPAPLEGPVPTWEERNGLA